MNFKEWREDVAKRGLTYDLASLIEEVGLELPARYFGDCEAVLESIGYRSTSWPTGWSWLKDVAFDAGQATRTKAPFAIRDEVERATYNATKQAISSALLRALQMHTPIQHRI